MLFFRTVSKTYVSTGFRIDNIEGKGKNIEIVCVQEEITMYQ
jgi:hypothetical protein